MRCRVARGRLSGGRRLLPLIAVLGALVVAGCGDSGGTAGSSQSAASWAAPNGDAANHRRATGSIDAASVDHLSVAWRLPLAAGYAATPIVVDGVVYTQDLQSNVYAIGLADGRLRWRHDYQQTDIGPNGVNVVGGRVFGATQTSAFALDAESGRQLWSTLLAHHPGDAIDMAPGYSDGLLYVSTAVAGGGAVGTLWALDADTGEARWSWKQVPEDLWGDPGVNSGGGLWHPPAFDDDGALYVSIANPLPFPGVRGRPWGTSRPGPNRWTNSLAKLDAATGRLRWARQVLPHDLYDWDLQLPPILDRVDGRLVVLTGGKMGVVYAFDADSGRLIWKRPVGLHNGHDDDNLLALRGRYHPRGPQKVLPGWWGGVETQMASDGAVVYAPVNDLPTVFTSGEALTPPNAADGTGRMVAIDIASGRVRWDRRLPRTPYGAATISNDLVFTTTYDGTVWALARDSGEVVWRTRLAFGTNAPLVVAGDILIAAASVPLEGQQPQLVAYLLDAGN
jgi:outer membrane protein assembly factor BamB